MYVCYIAGIYNVTGTPQKNQTDYDNEIKKIVNENLVEWDNTTRTIFDGEDSKNKRFGSFAPREAPSRGHRRTKGAIITPPRGRSKGKGRYTALRMNTSNPPFFEEEEDEDEDEDEDEEEEMMKK
ncbi:uncharacterized protein LOC125218934 [Salvia hispanica]|uniref:uncharacterized protein LOC125218934 n=1 Tax=Salvia hispanica TaxID=49212 RepID=UPI002009510B|nr:uncharacterized protein LOC125218934 [Salvia hispanica]